MRQQTQNESVRSRIDTQIFEGRRNITYLEERMQELQLRKMPTTGGDNNMGFGSQGPGMPLSAGLRNNRDGPPTPLLRIREEVILKLDQIEAATERRNTDRLAATAT